MRALQLTVTSRSFARSVDIAAWPVQREHYRGGFQKKCSTKPRKSQALTWGLRTNTLPSICSANLSKVYLKFFVANVRDFYSCFWLRGRLVEYPRLLIISPVSLNNF